jgi:hypothetical protein
MGYYLEVPVLKEKAVYLCENHGATPIGVGVFTSPTFPPPEGKVLICVVDNGPFEAAGICYDDKEFSAFNGTNDFRPRIWLHIDRKDAIALCPKVEGRL